MAGSDALKDATTPPIITMRLRRYLAGDTRLIMVSGPPHRRTTFSNCMKMSIEKIETSAATRHSHDSTSVGNTVCQDIRWSAPNEAPKTHITGQRSLEWYNSGSQHASTISLAEASQRVFCWTSCNALSAASFSNTRGVRYQTVQVEPCFPMPSLSNALLTAMDSNVDFCPESISGRSVTDGVKTSFGLTHQKKYVMANSGT